MRAGRQCLPDMLYKRIYVDHFIITIGEVLFIIFHLPLATLKHVSCSCQMFLFIAPGDLYVTWN